MVFIPDPDRYQPFVLRPIVFGVFEVLLVNILIDGDHVLLRLAISALIVVGAVVLAVRASRRLR